MNFKVFSSLFVVLFAVNLSIQSPTLKDDSIKIIVEEVLDKVLNVSNTLLNKASELVDNIEKNEDTIKEKIVAEAVSIGKQLNVVILQVIDGLKDGATDDGKAVIACIDAERPATEAAFEKVTGDIGTCAVGEVPKVLTEVKTILSQLTDLRDDIQGQADTLKACSSDELTCLLGFVGTIIETVKKVPAVVSDDIHQVIELVKTIISDVTQGCAGDVISEITSSLQDIFNEAVVCIIK